MANRTVQEALEQIRSSVNTSDMSEEFWAWVDTSRALAEEVERLRAKLPKTADGVPVVPGMTLWHPPSDDLDIDGTIFHSPACRCWAGPVHPWLIHCGTGAHSHAGPVDVREYYSTREAAEAAKRELQ